MSGEPELDAMGTVLDALQHLDPDAQTRVIRWVVEKLKLRSPSDTALTQENASTPLRDVQTAELRTAGLAAPFQGAAIWARQNGLTPSALESVFHFNGDTVDVIAAHISGKGNREKVLNCYVLAGIAEFLRTGDSHFTDKDARSLCRTFGCLDTTNHTKYLNEKGNEFTGSKGNGWTLTAPGKKRAAMIVKEITASSLE